MGYNSFEGFNGRREEIEAIMKEGIPEATIGGGKIQTLNNHEIIKSSDDLPEPVSGFHPLEDNTVYQFNGFVSSTSGLEIGQNTPIIGRFGSSDGFIHTGGGTAFKSSGNPFFMRDVYGHAPGGQLLDLQADNTTEFFVYDSAFSDAAGIGDMANLGVIDGFRVPTFKSVNIENFASGLTFTGTSNKIFLSTCPIRGITESGVTLLSFDSNLDTGIVDMSNNFIKEVQSDTEVVRVDSGATISEVFQYRGITHDQSITQDNILTGEAGVQEVGYRVTDSFPLKDSEIFASATSSSPTTVSISSTASSKTDESSYVKVVGDLSEEGSERINVNIGSGEYEYTGRRDRIAELTANLTVGTRNSDEIACAWFKNGSIVSGTPKSLVMTGIAGGIDKMINSTGIDPDVNPGDVYDVRVANLDTTTDINVGDMTAQISA